MNRLQLLLLTIVSAGWAGCAAAPDLGTHPATHPTSRVHIIYDGRPNLTEAEAIRIAEQAAIKGGYNLHHYATPKVRYSHTDEHDAWFIDYDGEVPRPGNHFSVRVHDKTRQAQLFRGR